MKACHWIVFAPSMLLANQFIILGVAEALYIPVIHGPIGPSFWQPHSTAAIVVGTLITAALCTLAFACFGARSDSPYQPQSTTMQAS